MMRSNFSTFWRGKLLPPFLCLFLLACTPTPPETVAGSFWAAALVGDKQGAAALAIPEKFDKDNFDIARYHHLFHQARIGEVEAKGGHARVATYLDGHFDSVDFDTILVRDRAGWRVDYDATTREMITALLDSAVDGLDLQIDQDMKRLSGSMNAAIQSEWRDLDRQLKEDQAP